MVPYTPGRIPGSGSTHCDRNTDTTTPDRHYGADHTGTVSATGITGNYLRAEYQHHEIPLSVLLQRGSDEGEKQRDIYRQQRRYHQYGIYAL